MIKILTNITKQKNGGLFNRINAISNLLKKNKDFRIIGVCPYLKLQIRKEIQVHDRHKNIFIPVEKKANIRDIKDGEKPDRIYKYLIEIFEKEINKEKPDVVLINGTYLTSWALLKAAINTNTPVVVCYAGAFREEVKRYKNVSLKKVKEIEKDFKNPIIKGYVFASIIAKEKIEKEIFKRKILNSYVIYNGITIQGAPNSVKKVGNVGMVARWDPIKNYNFLFKLADVNRNRENKLSLNVISGIKKTWSSYGKLCKISKVYGPMSYNSLVKFYTTQSCIICPSLFETFGNVALEALYYGTPALVSKNMGVSEVFGKLGLHNLIIEFNNPEKVYNKIIKLQNFQVPINVRERIEKEYSSEITYQKYLNIIKEVIKNN